MDWHAILSVLKQKSTIAGLVGIIGAVYAYFGTEFSAEQAGNVTAILLAVISVVAIVVQPRPTGGHYNPNDYKPGDSYEEPGQPVRVFDGKKWT